MNWYKENRWLGNFLLAFAASLVLANWFLFHNRAEYTEAFGQFNEVVAEHARLTHLNPRPSEDNFRKTQIALKNYGTVLNRAKADLKTQVIQMAALSPNEFQTRLRQAIANANERARTNRVMLPENFHLGFDEYTAALPDSATSALLGRQLNQVESLLDILIDDHVDAVSNLKRTASSVELLATAAARTPSAETPNFIQRSIVNVVFTASPVALRKVLIQIASSDRQFFILRALHVRSEKPKGPSREEGGGGPGNPAVSDLPTSPAAIKFIVGEEHLEVAACIEA